MKRVLCLLFGFGLVGPIAGCDDDATDASVERIRAIKPYLVTEPAGGAVRRYSGTVVASDTSALSFPVSGTVASVDVSQGEHVSAGQVLATLDTSRFDLDVQAATAQLTSAEANKVEKENALDRQRQLFAKGWVASAALDQAVAAFDAAEGELNLARSRLGTAERDLANTRLIAPFDGLIAAREVEPFEEVSAGAALLHINSKGALEINFGVADSIVARLAIGAPVVVDISAAAGCECHGRITEIGSTSGTANLVPVTAALLDGPPELLPGMSADVTVTLPGNDNTGGFLVPISAIAPGDGSAPGYIFKFDTDERVVRKVAVRAGDGGFDNLVSIAEGVSAGDIVAMAGVSFLRDGQSVKLLGE